MKSYYEEYWDRSDAPPVSDPLSPMRSTLLWQQVKREELYPTRLLEVGMGEGNLIAQAVERGIDAVGMDISEVAVERARALHPHCTFHVHPVEEHPWPAGAQGFDIVVSFEVIEHLFQPRDLVCGARDALRMGGYFGLTTPYHGLIKNLALAAGAFDRHFAVEGPHIRFFSDRALKRLLQQNGFEVRRLIHFGRCWGLWSEVFVWARRVQG